jgi:cytochrome c biogenesis protein CcdA
VSGKFRLTEKPKSGGSLLVAVAFVTGLLASALVLLVAGTATSYMEERAILSYEHFQKAINGDKPAAIMFKTPTCPVCKREYPFWHELELASDSLPVEFYSVTYNTRTAKIFAELGINEVPVYAVFANGRLLALRRGGFSTNAGEVNLTRTMLSWALSVAFGDKAEIATTNGKKTPIEASGATILETARSPVSVAVAMLSGLAAGFSPCVFPLLVAFTSASIRAGTTTRKLEPGSCSALAAGGALTVGLAFLMLGAIIASLQKVLLPAVAVSLTVAGFASLLGIPTDIGALFGTSSRGTKAFCTAYGFLSVQCNLPLVVGALLLIASNAGSYTAWISLAAFTAGIATPVALVAYAASRSARLLGSLTRLSTQLEKVAGFAMGAAGLYLLYYSTTLI